MTLIKKCMLGAGYAAIGTVIGYVAGLLLGGFVYLVRLSEGIVLHDPHLVLGQVCALIGATFGAVLAPYDKLEPASSNVDPPVMLDGAGSIEDLILDGGA